MKGVYLNEIPLDLFLKYFDENTVDETERTPVREDLKSNIIQLCAKNLNEADSEKPSTFMLPNGKLDIDMVQRLLGFSAYTEILSTDIGSHSTPKTTIINNTGLKATFSIFYSVAREGSDITISSIKVKCNSETPTEIEGEFSYTENKTAIFSFQVSFSNSEEGKNLKQPVDCYLMSSSGSSKLSLVLDFSKNNILFGLCDKYPYLISENSSQLNTAFRLYYAPSSSGKIASSYNYTLEIDKNDGANTFYKFTGANLSIGTDQNGNQTATFLADTVNSSAIYDICKLLDSNVIILKKAKDKYLDIFEYYTCEVLFRGRKDNNSEQFIIGKVIKNEPIQVPKMALDGSFVYKDSLGYIVHEKSVQSNLRRQRNALRSTFYNISSMNNILPSRVKEGELAILQKGNDINLVNYNKYIYRDYYGIAAPELQYDTTNIIPVQLSDEELPGRDYLYSLSDKEYTNVNTLLELGSLEKLKGYTSSIVKANEKDLQISFPAETKIIPNTVYQISPYIRKYKLFSKSEYRTLSLFGKVPRIFVLLSDTSGVEVSKNRDTSQLGDALGAVINGVSAEEYFIKTRKKYLSLQHDDTKIKISDDETYISNLTIYGKESGNPYVFFPVYVKDSMTRPSATMTSKCRLFNIYLSDRASDGKSENYLVPYLVYSSGGRYFIAENESSNEKYYLYSLSEMKKLFGIEITEYTTKNEKADIPLEDVYFCKYYINNVSEEVAGEQSIYGTLVRDKSENDKKSSDMDVYTLKSIKLSGSMRSIVDSNFSDDFLGEAQERVVPKDYIDDETSSKIEITSIEKYLIYLDCKLSVDDFAALPKCMKATIADANGESNDYYIFHEVIRDIHNLKKTYVFYKVYGERHNRNFDYPQFEYIDKENIRKTIPIIMDNYQAAGNGNAVDEDVYYNKKQQAISDIVKDIIDNPYESNAETLIPKLTATDEDKNELLKTTKANSLLNSGEIGSRDSLAVLDKYGLDASSLFTGMNTYDKKRVFSGGLYYFASHDGMSTELNTNTKERSLKPLSSLDPVFIAYIKERTSNINFVSHKDGLSYDAAKKINNLSPFTHLLMYKKYPVMNKYYQDLKNSSDALNDINSADDTVLINSDNSAYYLDENGNPVYKKQEPAVVQKNLKSSFAEIAYDSLLFYGTGDYYEKPPKSFKDTFESIGSKIKNAETKEKSFTNKNIYEKHAYSIEDLDEFTKLVLSIDNKKYERRFL